MTRDRRPDAPSPPTVVREAEGRGAVVVTVAVRNPYDVVHHAPTDAALATYGYAPVSVDAAAAALAGQGPAGGRLPVDVPEADGTGIRFPVGHGGHP